MLSRVIAKNVGEVFLKQCTIKLRYLLVVQVLCKKCREMRFQQRDEMLLFSNYFLCISRTITLHNST